MFLMGLIIIGVFLAFFAISAFLSADQEMQIDSCECDK